MVENIEIKKKLANYGFRKLNETELNTIFEQLKHAVGIGLERKTDPTEKDGGVLSIPTKSNFITFEQWEKVEYNNPVIACNYGGTNWVTGLRKKERNNLISIGEDVVKHFGMDDRKHSFNEFIEFMKEEILRLDEGILLDVEIIAIALGFAQKAEITDIGIDARILPGNMTKHWEISDMRFLPYTTLIGRALVEKLKEKLPKLKKVFIRNDAEAIGDDVNNTFLNHLPMSLVAGTGLGIVITRKRDNQNINLEIGRTPINIDTFGVIEYMYNAKLLPDRQNIIEYHIGGDYIKSKVLYGLKNLAYLKNMGILENYFRYENSSDIISKLALKEENLYISEDDIEISSIVAEAGLCQAGQLIACAFAAVFDAGNYANYFEGDLNTIATDGSMLHKAAIVMDEFKNTLKLLINNEKITPFEASGLDGIAKFALVKNS